MDTKARRRDDTTPQSKRLRTAHDESVQREVVSAAVEEVMHYLDPVVCALASDALDRLNNDGQNVSAAVSNSLRNVVSQRYADAIGKAILRLRREGVPSPRAEVTPSVPIPDWAAASAQADEALHAFSAWIAPDDFETAVADEIFAQIRFRLGSAESTVYGSRTNGGTAALFDSDVDVCVSPLLDLKRVALLLDDCDWTRDVTLLSARVPIVTGEHYPSGISFDISIRRAKEEVLHTDWPFFGPVARFCKLLLRQNNLDRVYEGGLGSYRLYVAIRCYLSAAAAAVPLTPHRALVAFLRYLARAAFQPLPELDLTHLESPHRLSAVCAHAADTIEHHTIARALVDIPALVSARIQHAARAKEAIVSASERRSNHAPPPAPTASDVQPTSNSSRFDALLKRHAHLLTAPGTSNPAVS